MEFFRSLSIYSLEYQVLPISGTNYNYWLGAFLRNNLLYAASMIYINDRDSLLDIINGMDSEIPGITRGYAIQCTPIVAPCRMDSLHVFTFRIQLFGRFVRFAYFFHQAVVRMCAKGIGHPMVPLQIINHNHISIVIPPMKRGFKQLRIEFISPTALYNNRVKSIPKQGILDKQNGMPNFYYLIMALSRRVNKLQTYYGNGTTLSDEDIDLWCDEARKACVDQCTLTRAVLKGTPRQGSSKSIYFSGYVGNLTISNVVGKYIPLLQLGTHLNVGNDTVYGLGQYELLTK